MHSPCEDGVSGRSRTCYLLVRGQAINPLIFKTYRRGVPCISTRLYLAGRILTINRRAYFPREDGATYQSRTDYFRVTNPAHRRQCLSSVYSPIIIYYHPPLFNVLWGVCGIVCKTMLDLISSVVSGLFFN